MAEQMKQEATGKAIPAGYKQTEVGVIPEDWVVANLSAITEHSRPISYGIVQTGPLIVNGVPCIRVVDISDGKIKRDNLITTTKEISNSYRRTILQDGDLIIPLRGKVGEVGLVDGDLVGANLTRGVALIAPQKDYTSEFIKQYLSNRSSADRLLSSMNGSALQEITIETLRRFSIALPIDVKEQTAIANVLSDSDALIDALEQLIAKKQAIKNATMQQLLTGRTRLPAFALRPDGTPKGYKPSELGEIPEDWEVKSVYALANNQKALFDDGDWIEAEHITDKGVRLIQTGNIGIGSFIEKDVKKYVYEKSFESLRCKELHIGDLLICRLAEPAGRACILPYIGETKVITSVDVTIFRPERNIANRDFLVQYFSSTEWFKSVQEQVGGTTHKRISRGALGQLLMPYPSLDEQTAIATILSDMDNELQALTQKLEKAHALKQGMMQQLLTGKIRLPLAAGA
ncbi:restriction endonuclease subunit S [Aeromonas hydrophila]|uniref:restriction endonuclease subunit S n=1 Tax=Aeromonas hydrophila TaxID=644 RepID=UPI001FF673B9|nr:restriction endonuclease subunit S [Aeromonas hydrophila]MCK0187736.1 restriction endonuclease subunit S [Aeromonas hydrophila]UOV90735.1 restriction endonuclease subunit S [Aeromonas hydrophila]